MSAEEWLEAGKKLEITVRTESHDGVVCGLIEVVARACKSISQAVNKGALGGVLLDEADALLVTFDGGSFRHGRKG